MKKVLEMGFRNEAGKVVNILLSDPKDTLTKSEVTTLMQDVIAKNIFSTNDGDLVQIVDAVIRISDVTELA